MVMGSEVSGQGVMDEWIEAFRSDQMTGQKQAYQTSSDHVI